MIDPLHPDYTCIPGSPQRPCFDYVCTETSAPPCVTIVTPFYNTGPIFHDTARSVLQQSLQQWHWLIINDGSTQPESLAVLDAYRHSDPRIQVIDHATNQGLSAARNTGFRQVKTVYVAQLDSDDLLESTALEKWAWCLESHPEWHFVTGYTVGFDAQEYLWERGFHEGTAFLAENLIAPTSLLRAAVPQAVGGYDEANRAGLEDWEFWLRCASRGYWGGTVPEYLDWYRRRPTHNDRWTNWDHGPRQRAFQMHLRQQYPHLWQGGFPRPAAPPHGPQATVVEELPWANRLHKTKPRLLLLVPWLTLGGADKFNLDVLEQLTHRGWEVTVATTLQGDHSWMPLFARHTPDIFRLSHFLRVVDYPRFLYYLIQSRQVDVVMLSHSELGYQLLPYLRAQCPGVTFTDFCHIEEEHWQQGGYPRMAIEHQGRLDLNIVASAHLQRWMTQHGAEAQRIHTCYINVDADTWRPDPQQRLLLRQELAVNDATPIVLYAGRMCAQKQPQIFADTMRWLTRQRVHFVALVAGDGPDLAWLQTFVRRQRLGTQVRLLGAVPTARMRRLMAAADVFFLPSQWEGIALSIYEAMACGLPIVGADVGGQRELVTPECGILLARSTDAVTEVAQYGTVLAALLADPPRRQQMGRQGRARVEASFRLEHMAERLLVLFEEARRRHEVEPRPVPSGRTSRLCVQQAVESLQRSVAADALWWEHEQHQMSAHTWRTRLYFTAKHLLLPYYRAGLSRDMLWLRLVKEVVKRTLLR